MKVKAVVVICSISGDDIVGYSIVVGTGFKVKAVVGERRTISEYGVVGYGIVGGARIKIKADVGACSVCGDCIVKNCAISDCSKIYAIAS